MAEEAKAPATELLRVLTEYDRLVNANYDPTLFNNISEVADDRCGEVESEVLDVAVDLGVIARRDENGVIDLAPLGGERAFYDAVSAYQQALTSDPRYGVAAGMDAEEVLLEDEAEALETAAPLWGSLDAATRAKANATTSAAVPPRYVASEWRQHLLNRVLDEAAGRPHRSCAYCQPRWAESRAAVLAALVAGGTGEVREIKCDCCDETNTLLVFPCGCQATPSGDVLIHGCDEHLAEIGAGAGPLG